MNDEFVEKFNNGNFNQGSGVSKLNYYNPKNLKVQHIPVKEKLSKVEFDRLSNGYTIDTLTY